MISDPCSRDPREFHPFASKPITFLWCPLSSRSPGQGDLIGNPSSFGNRSRMRGLFPRPFGSSWIQRSRQPASDDRHSHIWGLAKAFGFLPSGPPQSGRFDLGLGSADPLGGNWGTSAYLWAQIGFGPSSASGLLVIASCSGLLNCLVRPVMGSSWEWLESSLRV